MRQYLHCVAPALVSVVGIVGIGEGQRALMLLMIRRRDVVERDFDIALDRPVGKLRDGTLDLLDFGAGPVLARGLGSPGNHYKGLVLKIAFRLDAAHLRFDTLVIDRVIDLDPDQQNSPDRRHAQPDPSIPHVNAPEIPVLRSISARREQTVERARHLS